MGFDSIRTRTSRDKGKCAYCNTNDKAGLVVIQVKDGETRSVAHRSIPCCEECGVIAYQAGIKAITPKVAAVPTTASAK